VRSSSVTVNPFLLMVVGFSNFLFTHHCAGDIVGRGTRSLEPLLATPRPHAALYRKVLASTIPPLVGSLLGVTVYLVESTRASVGTRLLVVRSSC
jgi:hypothetical protein